MKKILITAILTCGLLSARATLNIYTVNFSSLGEAISSPGVGVGTVSYDDFEHSLTLACSFSGLLGTTTASHLHAPTAMPFTGNAGVATTLPTLALFPLGVTSGTYCDTLDLTMATSYSASFINANGGTTAGAEMALAAALVAGKAYWNIHTTAAGGGEIRGFLVPIPEPSSLSLIGLLVVMLLIGRTGRRGSPALARARFTSPPGSPAPARCVDRAPATGPRRTRKG